MSFSPKDYAGTPLSPEEESYLMTLESPELISHFLHQREIRDGYRVADPMNSDVLHEVDRSQMAQVSASIKVNGKQYDFVGNSQADIDAQQAAILRNVFQSSEPARLTTTNDSVARTADGRFARQEQEPSRTQGLDDITNNLVLKSLQDSLGISPDELQASVAQIQHTKKEIGSWEQATIEFKNQHPDWRGGEHIVEAIGNKIAELGLQDKPSAKSIQLAYDSLVADASQYERLQNAQTPQEIREALGISERERMRARNGNSY
jgi:hypothetical protein